VKTQPQQPPTQLPPQGSDNGRLGNPPCDQPTHFTPQVLQGGLIPSALTVDWSEWAGTLGEAHGLALQKPVSHQGGWYQ